ncbi:MULTISPECIES: tRNA (mnm(5)s(2)U34)-methyltransferase [Rubinisphaera]|uniref:rRNA methylase n=1 Tax=Rubinisphaera brasiliensis (strain ATCC 49424 / DSM 5305 / JCM 21570 / IAM 15109 / NBRC 103401 / IFAM 1448) TaxID=756272 RepID=F0SFN4_RUBBR|nr:MULTISPECIES: class I SAM-dependent methyltransferase [Rubinisphaera]ADY60494.1 rRNA methylase [Rubinisphaera brasiliensis DSM 5305]
MGHISLVDMAHAAVQQAVQPGDCVIDATAGNGHDTLILAEAVFPEGQVHAFDIQPSAIEQTRLRLPANLSSIVSLYQASHAEMPLHLPPESRGQVAAILFNLGYLPGGDKELTTRESSTLAALQIAADWLKPGGLLSILAYVGHPGGGAEAEAVESWLQNAVEFETEQHRGESERSPRLFLARRV